MNDPQTCPEGSQPATVFELYAQEFSPTQRDVLSSYCRAFASRDLFIRPISNPGAGPYLFTGGTPLVDKEPHCFWSWDDNAGLDPEADGCAWIWHPGPTREIAASEDRRLILLPRNDLFEVRGIHNTQEGWADYRERIGTKWSEKRNEIYFRGHFTGDHSPRNARALACRLIESAGLPANLGVLAETTPPELLPHVPVKEPEPLDAMGQYKFVLSLWGNHPFNPRLYRGLEAGSLVFHQATPTVRFLEDGLLVAGHHYVEIAPDLSDLVEKVDYFLSHPSEARDVAAAGRQAWVETLFVSTPYTISDVIWERFTSQPHWRHFHEMFAVP
jgi:hypothetical protein